MDIEYRGVQVFEKSRSYLEISDARKATWSKAHTGDEQVLGATIKNSVATAIWYPVFVHP